MVPEDAIKRLNDLRDLYVERVLFLHLQGSSAAEELKTIGALDTALKVLRRQLVKKPALGEVLANVS